MRPCSRQDRPGPTQSPGLQRRAVQALAAAPPRLPVHGCRRLTRTRRGAKLPLEEPDVAIDVPKQPVAP
jgi:hypothetical protein